MREAPRFGELPGRVRRLGRSLKLYLVLALHDVVALALMGAILGAWR